MATTNFLQVNNASINQETDAQYTVDPIRTGGAPVTGELPSPLFNKLAYQLSTFVAAFGEMLANKGFSNSDADINVLSAVLANIQTSADVPDPLILVPYSPTPTLAAANVGGFFMTLTGNSAIQAVAGLTNGQLVAMYYLQDSVGGRAVTFPSIMFSATAPDTAPGALSIQLFRFDGFGGGFLRPAGPLVSNNGLFVNGAGSFSGALDVAGNATVAGSLIVSEAVDAPTGNMTELHAGDITSFTAEISTLLTAAAASVTGNATVGALLTAASALVTGGLNVGTLQVASAGPIGQVLTGDGTHFVPQAIPKPQQTLNDVTGARSFVTTYTNNTGAPITVSVTMGRSASGGGDYRLDGFVGGLAVASNTSTSTITGMTIGITFQVPNGSTYGAIATNLQGAAAVFLQRWIEWTYV
jgi:hypothetical protein